MPSRSMLARVINRTVLATRFRLMHRSGEGRIRHHRGAVVRGGELSHRPHPPDVRVLRCCALRAFELTGDAPKPAPVAVAMLLRSTAITLHSRSGSEGMPEFPRNQRPPCRRRWKQPARLTLAFLNADITPVFDVPSHKPN